MKKNTIPADVLNLITKSKNLKKLGSLKQHPAYESLCNITSFLDQNCHVKCRIWHVINDMWELPTCKICGKQTRWRKEHGCYNTYCSSKCAHADPGVLGRARASLLKNHGEEKAFGTKAFRKKNIENITAKYGTDNVSKITSVKEAKIQTSLKNHGVEHPMKSKAVRTKVSNTNKIKYGHTNFLASDIGKEKLMLHYADNCGIYQSKGEKEVFKFVQSISPNVVANDRTLLFPLELDIVDHQKKVAIEYCGLFWHSEQQGKDKWYHHNKWDRCYELGYQLITIYSDEWEQKSEIIKRKLTHMFQKSNDFCYARKTHIDTIPPDNYRTFFERYHIQGCGTGKLAYGLIHSGEMVACILLKRQGPDYLIDRYATSKRVPGGFSKLISFIEHTLDYRNLLTFADLRWSLGDLYKSTGFVLDKILPPDYSYSHDGIVRRHKFNYRRKNLPRLLKDFDPNLSEKQNCNKNNILRIWDCGKWRWNKPRPNETTVL